MTRRDYVLLAEACKAGRECAAAAAASSVDDARIRAVGAELTIRVLANRLQAENPRFDRDRFLVAAGVTP